MADPIPGVTVFTARQVCDIARLTYRNLDYWVRTGLVQASIQEAEGSGRLRQFSHRDLELVVLIVQLRALGFSLPSIREGVSGSMREWMTKRIAFLHEARDDWPLVEQAG